MTWRPDYQRDVCERLHRAAECIRGTEFTPLSRSEQDPAVWGKLDDEKRQRLVRAGLGIYVFRDDEFPADFRTQFRAIMSEVTAGRTTSIEKGVAALPVERVVALGNEIVALYEETCADWRRKR